MRPKKRVTKRKYKSVDSPGGVKRKFKVKFDKDMNLKKLKHTGSRSLAEDSHRFDEAKRQVESKRR